jgi:beta-lactam-binding protein with PASTA domain
MPTVLLYNITDVQNMAADLAGTYALANAIDASATATWNETAPGSGVYYGFAPIGTGTGAGRATCTLDGMGNAITGLYINRPASDYQGLFGATNGATITRVSISGAVTGKEYCGAIVGRAYSTTISLCSTSATMVGVNYIGGLVGWNSTSSAIANCHTSSVCTASSTYAGGAVGANQTSTITNVYSTGNATGGGGGYAGAFAGRNYTTNTISGCFAGGIATAGGGASSFVGFESGLTSSGSWLPVAELKKHLWTRTAGWNFATIWQQTLIMPDLVGQTLDAAGQLLYAQGMAINSAATTYQYSATVAKGLIISQSVAAGTGTAGLPTLQAHGVAASPKTGDTVDVVVSLGDQVEVQNTLGLTQAAAEALLTADGFTVTVVETTSETVAAGLVFSQDPAGGTSATYESDVEITISTGRADVTVPDVVDDDISAAIISVEDAGLLVALSGSYSETVALGYVISQDPAAGVSVAYGSAVNIELSLGVQTAEMPDVVGLTQAAAVNAIEGAGFVASVSTDYSETVDAGDVISQVPDAGVSVETGSDVCIVVSLGVEPTIVPDVVGDYYLAAQSLIGAEGLVYASTMAYSATVAAGYVISQSPAAGASVADGSTVTVTISRGTQVGPLMYTMNTIKTVLSRSAAFRTWAGVATEALALGHIGILAIDSDKLPMAVVSPGNWEREVVTLDGKSLTKPAVVIEFCKGVTRSDSEATVFATLIAAVDSIMLDIEAQGLWINLKWSPLNEDTPRRAGYAATTADWVGFSIVIEGDENEEI